MRAIDLQQIGHELAIKWEDQTESFIPLENLRRACPCAACKGERDVMGNLYKGPERPLTPLAFQLRGLTLVGAYGVQPYWGDGHNSGIFPFDYLLSIASEREGN